MTLGEWLDGERGRAKRLAEHFHVTPSAVSQWRTNGVPVDKMVDVRAFTGGRCSIEDLLHRGPASQETAA